MADTTVTVRPDLCAENYADATSLEPDAKYDLVAAYAPSRRADHMRYSLALPGTKRLTEIPETRDDLIAVVGLGPSLEDTWPRIKDFPYILSMSGSHKFLLDHGIVPTWHVDIDPRPHKVGLMGPPHKDVKYLISSHCHPTMFRHLDGYDVTLIHPQSQKFELARLVPRGEWAFQGGPSVGNKALVLARYLGFTDIHVFGFDGCVKHTDTETVCHAVKHPNPIQRALPCPYDGVTYWTAPNLINYAQKVVGLLDRLIDTTVTFYGEGFVQHLARNRVPMPASAGLLCLRKDLLVTPEYRELLRGLYEQRIMNEGGGLHLSEPRRERLAGLVTELTRALGSKSVLDYGCGEGHLGSDLPFPIWEYDPAVPGKDVDPRAADLVVAIDVLEHVEPEKLDVVLQHLDLCTRQTCYVEIATRPAKKTLADGRNAHLIVEDADWWRGKLGGSFYVAKEWVIPEFSYHAVLTRKHPHPDAQVGA